MQFKLKITGCAIIVVIILYLMYTLTQPKEVKPVYMRDFNYINNDDASSSVDVERELNVNAARSQESGLILDRQPMIEENPTIIPANEVLQATFKDFNKEFAKDQVKKELYADDAELFNGEPAKIVPIDINSTHRRINFY